MDRSETFCIANIEVMSMAIPLVTLAVGGVGEYVSDVELYGWAALPVPEAVLQTLNNSSNLAGDGSTRSQGSSVAPLYSINTNAIVVHEAIPQALALAARELVFSPELRRLLGAAARRTVARHFGPWRQMQLYADLYATLARARRARRGMAASSGG